VSIMADGMTTKITATFDGKVLIPAGEIDLPKGAVLELQLNVPRPRINKDASLAKLAACGMWAGRTDLSSASAAARRLRRRVETGKDHEQ
jgi:hypothetical protein